MPGSVVHLIWTVAAVFSLLKSIVKETSSPQLQCVHHSELMIARRMLHPVCTVSWTYLNSAAGQLWA